MVAPLIAGAARIGTSAARVRVAKKGAHSHRRIASNGRHPDVLRKHPQRSHHQADLENTLGRRRRLMRTSAIPRNLPYNASKHTSPKSRIKKLRKLAKEIATFGNAVTYAGIQIFFGIAMLVSLRAEDGFWGFLIPGIYMATLFWVVATFVGTATMLSSMFVLGSRLKDTNVVLAGMACFIGNIVPGIQIVPWTVVWIAYIILHKS